MPELPQDEPFCRGLAAALRGRIICQAEVYYPRIIRYPEAEAFVQMMENRRVEGVARSGKYAIIQLDREQDLIVHFRMTAHFLLVGGQEPPDKHAHVIFFLDDGSQLRFVEPRKFGTMHLVPRDRHDLAGGIVGLGPEPLSEGFTSSYLEQALAGRHAKIKSALLDQRIVAGLGNIYVDETLFRAGIRPGREAASLSAAEITALVAKANEVISEAILCRGSSIRDYCGINGEKGSYQEKHNVYGRTGKQCHVCGCEILRSVIGGRSAHYCPHCQR